MASILHLDFTLTEVLLDCRLNQ